MAALRSRLVSSALAWLIVIPLFGTAADAGVLAFTATLSVEIIDLPISVNGGGDAVVNGSGGGTHLATLGLPAGAIATSGLVLPITASSFFPIRGFQLTAANGAGNFVGSGGVMPLLGVAKICLFGPCSAAVANVSVPLSVVGVGGAASAAAAVNITVHGAPWTTGTATIMSGGTGTATRMGFRHGPLGNTSSTAAPSGQVQLVTPIYVSTNIGSSSIIPTFAVLTLHFVPEPGTMLLIGAGLAGMGVAGQRRLVGHRGGRRR